MVHLIIVVRRILHLGFPIKDLENVFRSFFFDHFHTPPPTNVNDHFLRCLFDLEPVGSPKKLFLKNLGRIPAAQSSPKQPKDTSKSWADPCCRTKQAAETENPEVSGIGIGIEIKTVTTDRKPFLETIIDTKSRNGTVLEKRQLKAHQWHVWQIQFVLLT